jgi:hypothetical protein
MVDWGFMVKLSVRSIPRSGLLGSGLKVPRGLDQGVGHDVGRMKEVE